jgi:hypothetical protein
MAPKQVLLLRHHQPVMVWQPLLSTCTVVVLQLWHSPSLQGRGLQAWLISMSMRRLLCSL